MFWLFRFTKAVVRVFRNNKIKSKVLTDAIDLQAFVDSYNQGTNKRTVKDLQGYFVRAFYQGSDMLGGYSINTKEPYFHVEMIPPENRPPFFSANGSNNFTEIRCLWIRNKSSNLLRATVYCRSVLDAAATKPKYIIGGTFAERYKTTQMRALPDLLYFGDVHVWGKTQRWWIYCATPMKCICRLPYAVVGGWTDRQQKK